MINPGRSALQVAKKEMKKVLWLLPTWPLYTSTSGSIPLIRRQTYTYSHHMRHCHCSGLASSYLSCSASLPANQPACQTTSQPALLDWTAILSRSKQNHSINLFPLRIRFSSLTYQLLGIRLVLNSNRDVFFLFLHKKVRCRVGCENPVDCTRAATQRHRQASSCLQILFPQPNWPAN